MGSTAVGGARKKIEEKCKMKKQILTTLAAGVLVCGLGLTSCGSSGIKMIEIPGKDFKMSATEITQKQYEEVMGENPSYFNKDKNAANNPVEKISWYDAIYFCNKLSINEGKTPVYKVYGESNVTYWDYTPHKGNTINGRISQNTEANGYRLPTVEEWKYAAKGGMDYLFAGSDDLTEVAWCQENSDYSTHSVGKKKPNGYGLYDMYGNVSEWCWDEGIYFEEHDNRKTCGDSYETPEEYFSRAHDDCASSRDDGIGLRIVCLTPKTTDIQTPKENVHVSKIDKHISKLGIKMIKIPGTDFKMSSTEITQKQYSKLMGENPSWFQKNNQDKSFMEEAKNKIDKNTSNYPVENISWCDAIYFCNKLSIKGGKSPVYKVNGESDVTKWDYTPHKKHPIHGDITQDIKADGYRLPMLEEWQYAAKGGENYLFAGSDDLTEVAWCLENSNEIVHQVALKKANGYGLYDMSGNVTELCWDMYYNDELHDEFVYNCGGSFDSDEWSCKVKSKYGYRKPWQYYKSLGFRIVCNVD